MKKLGFGLMRLPHTDADNPGSVDFNELNKMVDAYLESGFNYFDTAWMYCASQSEPAVKEAIIKRHDRDKYTIATKLHHNFIQTEEDRDKIFNAQLEKTGAGYFDYYLIHGVDGNSYDKYQRLNVFSWLKEKKEAGLVKHMGFSFHAGAALLEEVLTDHPEVEFVQLQLNYLDWLSPAIQAKECYDICVKHGKKVIVMEPVKGGTLASLPKKAEELLKNAHPDWSVASWAIRFAASLPAVMMVLSGMSNLSQMEDNCKSMREMEPLTEEEMNLLQEVVAILNGADGMIPCTGCAYCVDGCPMQIAIPQYFNLYNLDIQEAAEKGWHPQGNYYKYIAKTHGKASECISCGQCENVCPQHLPIIENLTKVAALFE